MMGIMAALIIPRFTPQGERARAAEAVAMLSVIRLGEEAHFLEKGSYLERTTDLNLDWGPLGMQNPNGGNRFFNYSVTKDETVTTPNFTARAARNGTNDTEVNINKVIGLKQDGLFCGNHPNTPYNGAQAPSAC